MEHVIKVSVRELAEYVYSSGSIETGFRSSMSLTEGTRIHREVQKNYQEHDQSEVFLKTRIEFENLLFKIEGRCDGLLYSEGQITIDEIKSTAGSLVTIEEHTFPAHWAQALCYAYMALQDSNLEEIHVQLTYVQKTSGEIKRFIRTKTREQLEQFIRHLMSVYAPYAMLRREHEVSRNTSIKNVGFPFRKYRAGQRQFAGSVYKTIVDNETLFASAPTGIGKTISTIFPAVKAIGEGHLQKIFYLTAKTTTRQTAEEAFEKLRGNGLVMIVVTITAKDKICFNDDGACSNGACEYAQGYYDRINAAAMDILSNERALTREIIETYAIKHKVCPFEFSLDLAYVSDAVICDYNYIFDPKVSLKRLFDDQKKQSVLLVDEAHNLVDRGRTMFSAALEKTVFLKLKREYKGKNRQIYETSKAINDQFISIRKQADSKKEMVFQSALNEFNDSVSAFCDYAEKELLIGGDQTGLLREVYFSCKDWVRISKLYDERFVLYAEVSNSEVRLKQFCLDPSQLLKQAAKNFKARIFFSATLSPMQYFKEMLGGSANNYEAYIPSPFSIDQTEVMIKPISTRYHDRENSIVPIVLTLLQKVKSVPGNYLIFFPSYHYLNMVLQQWSIHASDIATIVQGTGMGDSEREAFLDSFQDSNEASLIGFAVLGGVFSEGVDLQGDRLNGVIVVGVGLPQLGFERDLIKQYFTAAGKNGYDYAYVYPGMNKVLQAGGRLIRSETDSGSIILMDDRYLQKKYQNMLPEEWRNFTII